MLTGKDNATVKRYAALLKDGKARAAQNLFLLEGGRLVADAVRAGAELEAVFVREGEQGRFSDLIAEIILRERARPGAASVGGVTVGGSDIGGAIVDVPEIGASDLGGADAVPIRRRVVFEVAETLFSKLCDTATPQGIVAAARIPAERPYGGGDALVLDGVRDPGNLGTLIRSAAGFGFKDVYLINCADVYAPKAVRSSMSAIFNVNPHIIACRPKPACHSERSEKSQPCADPCHIERSEESQHCADPGHTERSEESQPYAFLDGLKRQGVQILVADMDGADVRGYRKKGPVAVIIGGEARGVSQEARGFADAVLSVRTANIESLNAAVAGSVMMFFLNDK
ncbi:MAG: RNA methyltransferase [Clostridiales bacterium]|jgi:TrmH family RNA methyltransferase|nr:RNA methyltransferase [Clostridiales bacterium]